MSESVVINGRKLTKQDVHHLKMALDIYQRLMMGQFDEVAQYLKVAMENSVDAIRLSSIRDKFRECHNLIHHQNPKGWSIFAPEVSLSACYANKIEQLLLGNQVISDEMQAYIDERDRGTTMNGFQSLIPQND